MLQSLVSLSYTSCSVNNVLYLRAYTQFTIGPPRFRIAANRVLITNKAKFVGDLGTCYNIG